jgi:hypothetical protein
MRSLITTTAVLLILGSAAMAQTGGMGSPRGSSGSLGSSGIPSTVPEAPVGHRQPRADQVPSEKNLNDPSNPVNREDAALDRKIKSICRGC